MPTIKFFSKKKQKPFNNICKLNIANIFLHNEKNVKTINRHQDQQQCNKKNNQFDKLLQNEIIDIQKLKKLAWNGIPSQYRSKTWKILLKYTSTNKQNYDHFLNNKRKDYFHMVNSYIHNPNIEYDNYEKKVLKLIHDDVVRTMPESPLFRQTIIQEMIERILYVWHIRHPSSGYVQGLNDIVTPFIIVFLSDYIQINLDNVQVTEKLSNIKIDDLKNLQADSYWCFTKLLNQVLDNYANTWPGIQKSFVKIKEIINRIDPDLTNHFETKGIDFYHIYFKWVTCLLLRQFSTKIGLRLFDTFISLQASEGTFFKFIQYIFIAVFLKFSKKMKKLNFEDLMAFEHKMPTKNWDQQEISTIIAEAFVYQNYFNQK